jgi:hypothetical protein
VQQVLKTHSIQLPKFSPPQLELITPTTTPAPNSQPVVQPSISPKQSPPAAAENAEKPWWQKLMFWK